jgi:hypothetical protein
VKSYLEGRNNHHPAMPRSSAGNASGLAVACAAARAPSGQQADGATVECVKMNGKVTQLIVTCGCGAVIEIGCLYPDE